MPKVGVNNDPLLERLIFGYDGTAYRVVKIDTDGNLVAAIKASQEIEVVQDTAADLKATVNIAASQTIEVTQDTPANLKASVDNVPRIPPGVTDLSNFYSVSIADNAYAELLTNTTGATFADTDGRVVDNGKRLAVAWASGATSVSTDYMQIAMGYDSTITLQLIAISPSVIFAPSVVFYLEGNGTKELKICCRNQTSATKTCSIAALVWEETG